MKNYEQIIGEAVRVEVEEHSGKVFVVFEIKDEKLKKTIISDWTKDIEYRLKHRFLIEGEDE